MANNKSFAAQLANCECCPRKCSVNRLEGETGFCHVASGSLISHSGPHFGEEPPISGIKGSGAIFFAGCNLKCVFCQNYQISQEFQSYPQKRLSTDELALEMLLLQEKGVHNINFVSPSHMIFQMADAIYAAKKKGFVIPVVYNSNGYDSVDALKQISGLVDIYLPDIKYMDNELGEKLSAVNDYADIVPEVLKEMLHQVGHLKTNNKGIAQRGLLVRHLVLPGFLRNSRKCLSFLSDLSKNTYVSIMSQYSPQYQASNFSGINRALTKDEYNEIVDYAIDIGLKNAFIQEIESQDNYLPDFGREAPFV